MASSYPAFRPLSSFRIGGDGHYSEFHELDPDHMPDEADLIDMLGVVHIIMPDESGPDSVQP
jgi:hypothetical protein